MYLYDEILRKIKEKGQALQGMYPMDAQYLFKKIFLYRISISLLHSRDKKDQLYDAYLKDLESQ